MSLEASVMIGGLRPSVRSGMSTRAARWATALYSWLSDRWTALRLIVAVDSLHPLVVNVMTANDRSGRGLTDHQAAGQPDSGQPAPDGGQTLPPPESHQAAPDVAMTAAQDPEDHHEQIQQVHQVLSRQEAALAMLRMKLRVLERGQL